MGDLYEPLSKLPKNIRQIGDQDDTVKLYMEDYVSTYLKRLIPSGGQDLRVGLLLGTEKTEDGTSFIFIDGALEMEDVTAEGEKVEFTEAAWKKAYQNIEESFPRRTVQGWFLCGAPGCTLSPLNYWKQHGQYFSEKNQLMYLNSGLEGEESIYIMSEDGFYRLKGYSIYYDKNQMMQDYMICRKDVKRVESGSGDRVIRDFRERMEDRKQEAMKERHTVRNLGLLCSTMSLVIMAGGVAMINNYQKMQEMETVLVSVLPEGARPWNKGENEREESVPVMVEEIKGNIYPEKEEMKLLPSKEEEGEKKTQDGSESSEEWLENGEIEIAQSKPDAGTEESKEPEKEGGRDENEGVSDSIETADEIGETDSPKENGQAVESVVPVTEMKPGGTYLVGDGETLYGICFKLYGNVNYVKDICALNGMADINHIVSGQKLILPEGVPVAEGMEGVVE